MLHDLNCSNHLSDHVVEDSAVLIVSELELGVKPDYSLECFASINANVNNLLRTQLGRNFDGEVFLAGQTKRIGIFALGKLKWNNPHSNQVRAMDSLVGFGNNGTNSLEERSLGSPISGRSGSVITSSQDDQVLALAPVLFGGVKHIHGFVGRQMQSIGSGLSNEFVDQTDVGERSSCHDGVIASARSVAVELTWSYSLRAQESAN